MSKAVVLSPGESFRGPAERRYEVMRLRAHEGWSLRAIAAELGISVTQVQKDYKKALADDLPPETVAEARRVALDELDWRRREVLKILRTTHYAHSFGKVIMLPDPATGEDRPLEDSGPKLAALRELGVIERDRRDIIGFKAPNRATLTVITEDLVDAEIARLEAELGIDPGESPAELAS
jgi:hypothetical protein